MALYLASLSNRGLQQLGDVLLSLVEEHVWMTEMKNIRKRQWFYKSLLLFPLVAGEISSK